jgi:hypothetical protein
LIPEKRYEELFGKDKLPHISAVSISTHLSLRDLRTSFQGLNEQERGQLWDYLFMSSDDADHVPDIAKKIDARLNSGYDLFFRVRANVPEKILTDLFVKAIRREGSNNKRDISSVRYRRPDIDNWVRLGLLPFIDLKIWEMQQGAKISNRIMADAIFAMGEGGEETVRKTTEVLARQVIDGDMLDVLAGLSDQEGIS